MENMSTSARIAGVWYFIMLITGVLGLMVIPSRIILPGDAAGTAANLLNASFLFRCGIVVNLLCQIAFVFLVLQLYRIFRNVNRDIARLMVALVLIAVPIAFLNELTQIAALMVSGSPDYLDVFSKSQRDALQLFCLNLHEQGVIVAGFFWGLWLLPFGRLVIVSKMMPKVIGLLLMVGCFSYLIDSCIALLFPEKRGVVTDLLMLPLSAGEISSIFWLLFKGVKT